MRLHLLLGAAVAAFLLGGCWQDSRNLDPTPATPLPARPALVSADPGPWAAPVAVTTTLDLDHDLSVQVPQGWAAAVGQAAGAVAAVPAGETLLLAWRDAPAYVSAPTRVSVVRTLRHGLGLVAYLDGLEDELAQHAGVQVEQSSLNHTLRRDGQPAGEILFRSQAGAVIGYQAVLIDAAAEHLILVSVAAPADSFDVVLPQVQALIRSLTVSGS